MPSTYSDKLRLELQATGENNSTWGEIANDVFELIENSIAKVASVSMTSDANYTLTALDGTDDEARCAVLSITSTVSLTATRNVTCPTKHKVYLVYNGTSGSQSIQIKTSGGTGITIPNGKKRMVYCDGTNVVDAITDLPSGTTINNGAIYAVGGTDVAISDGGTGSGTAAGAATNLGLGTGDSPQFTGVNVGHATDTTITRASAGVIAVEGNNVLTSATGQPLDSDLTAIAALTTSAAGRSVLTIADPGEDRIIFWDDSAGGMTTLALPARLSISNTSLLLEETWVVPCSDETTALTTGTAKASFVFPWEVTMTDVGASVNTAGTGLTIDINVEGSTRLSTKLTLDSGEKTSLTAATDAVISNTTFSAGQEVTIDLDAVSGTYKGLKVWFTFRKNTPPAP